MIDYTLQKLLVEKFYDDEGDPNDDLKKKYQNIFNSPDGQLVLEDLRHRFFIYAPAPGQIEEGERRTVLHIESCLMPIEPPAETEARD